MSEWYEIEDEDIRVDSEDGKEMEVILYVKQNEFGSVYATLTPKQIESIYNQIHQVQT